jgi:hypothetical protein
MIGAAALLFALSVGLVNAQLRPALIELAKTRVQAIASDAMYEAVLGCINAQPEETSYVDILKTADQVYYVEINNKELSLLAANCARAVQKSLSQVGQQGVQVTEVPGQLQALDSVVLPVQGSDLLPAAIRAAIINDDELPADLV